MIIRILKSIRSSYLVNVPVRIMMKAQYNLALKIHRFLSIHWPVSGIIRIKLPGSESFKIFAKTDDHIAIQAFWKGFDGYEGPSVKLFYLLAKKLNSIIDIGANTGYFSLIAGAANPKAAIYSFEPSPKIFNRLVSNIKLNNLINVKPFNAAIGNNDAQVKFYLPNTIGMAMAGSITKGWYNNTTEIQVDCFTLDNFKSREYVPKIALIKMDCELNEVEALKGMKIILKEDKPIIIMEVLFVEGKGATGEFENNLHLQIQQILKENGYYFYLINESALVRLDTLEFNPEGRNYLFSTKKSDKVYLPFSEDNLLLQSIL